MQNCFWEGEEEKKDQDSSTDDPFKIDSNLSALKNYTKRKRKKRAISSNSTGNPFARPCLYYAQHLQYLMAPNNRGKQNLLYLPNLLQNFQIWSMIQCRQSLLEKVILWYGVPSSFAPKFRFIARTLWLMTPLLLLDWAISSSSSLAILAGMVYGYHRYSTRTSTYRIVFLR